MSEQPDHQADEPEFATGGLIPKLAPLVLLPPDHILTADQMRRLRERRGGDDA